MAHADATDHNRPSGNATDRRKNRAELLRDGSVVEAEISLFSHREGAIVEIGRAYCSPHAIR